MSAQGQFLDAVEISDLRIPYDKFTKLLDNQPSLSDGLNVYQSQSGRLRKRGGTGDAELTAYTAAGRIDRLGLYKTNEDPPKVYLLASKFNDSAPAGQQWAMFYLRVDAGSPAWTVIPSLRGVNASSRAHEWVVARGKVYIKGFPLSATDLLGTVVFDGSGATPSTTYWGLLGPTTPARRNGTSASWAASPQSMTVRAGWVYVYTWKTLTGQESPRSPVETNPASTPSTTGAFTNKVPQMVVQGHADTTNIPLIVVYRSSDGGGSFRFLEEIPNTGAGNITYFDDSVSGNPVPDARLDPANVAPSLTSNTPPPAVVAPAVTGVDQIQHSTAPVYWRGRIWYAIGSVLFFSGDDEIRKGIPLECFPTGFFGNFFAYESNIQHLIPGEEEITVVTENSVEEITGRFREEFSTRTAQKIVGAATDQPRASLALGGAQFWLAQDYRVIQKIGRQFTAISPPLGDDLIDQVSTDVEWELGSFLANGITWLVVAAHNMADASLSRWWVYDLTTNLWSPPWAGMPSTALAYGRWREDDTVPALLTAAWDSGSPGTAAAARYTPEVFSDFTPGAGQAGFAFAATTGLLGPATGNQLNSRSVPGSVLNFQGLRVEWVGSPAEPTIAYATDSSADPTTALTGVELLQTASAPDGYTSKFYHAERAAQRAACKISRTADTEGFELESVAFLWEPRRGA